MTPKYQKYELFGASALIFLALFYLTRGVWGELGTHYLMGTEADPGLYIWLYNLPRSSFLSGDFFNGPHFFPFSRSLAFGDLFYLPYLAGQLLPFSEPLSYNLVVLGAMFLNGFFTYYLCRRFEANQIASLFASISFMGSSYFLSHLGQVQLQFAFFLPLTLLLTRNYFAKGNFGYALLLGLNFVAAFFTAAYYGIFSILLAGVWAAFSLKNVDLKKLARLGLGVAPSIVFLFIATSPYRLVRQSFGARNLANIKEFSGSPWSYFSAPNYNLLWGDLTSSLSHYEAHLFTGLTTKLLLLLGLFFLIREFEGLFKKLFLVALGLTHLFAYAYKRNLLPENLELYVYLACVPLWLLIISFWFFSRKESPAQNLLILLGPAAFFYFASLGIVGAPKADALSIDMNSLLRIIPGFDAIRATARYGVVTNLFEVIFVALALTKLCNSLGKKVALILPGVFCLASVIEARIDYFPRFTLNQRPEILAKLDSSPPGAAIILPFGHHLDKADKFSKKQTDAMLWISNRRIVNGYSGLIPQFTSELEKKVKNFPNQGSINYLKRLIGLKYIVYLPKEGFSLREFNAQLGPVSEELKLLSTDPNGNMLFELKPKFSGHKVLLLLEAKPEQTLVCKIRSLDQLANLEIRQSFNGKLRKVGAKNIGREPSTLSITLEKPFQQNRPVKLVMSSISEFELFECYSY